MFNTTRFTCSYGPFSASVERSTFNGRAVAEQAFIQLGFGLGLELGKIALRELNYRLQERRHHRNLDSVDAEFREAGTSKFLAVRPDPSMYILP